MPATQSKTPGIGTGAPLMIGTRGGIAAEYVFESRGKVDVKGKGEIETYMLINPR